MTVILREGEDKMIKVSPEKDEQKVAELFEKAHLQPADKDSAVLVAVDGDKTLGKCMLQMTPKGVVILKLDFDKKDASLADWLMRSAMNYAANRGAYLAFSSIEEYEDVLLNLGFVKKDNSYVGEVPEIFKSCKSCCAHDKQL